MSSIKNDPEFKEMMKEVKDAYPTEAWAWRVEHMKVNQVIAIAKSIRKRRDRKGDGNKQLSLFDLYPEIMAGGISK